MLEEEYKSLIGWPWVVPTARWLRLPHLLYYLLVQAEVRVSLSVYSINSLREDLEKYYLYDILSRHLLTLSHCNCTLRRVPQLGSLHFSWNFGSLWRDCGTWWFTTESKVTLKAPHSWFTFELLRVNQSFTKSEVNLTAGLTSVHSVFFIRDKVIFN